MHGVQKPARQKLLLQSALEKQIAPFPHLLQSRLHSSPELASPHFSAGPLQTPSPQRGTQRPATQLSLRQAASVVHGLPMPSPPAMQIPKLHTPEPQSELVRQGVPLLHRPQSDRQESGFPEPQVSVPSQKPSPQSWMQKPAVQSPLRQARSVVQGAPDGSLPAMQNPKLQIPELQSELDRQTSPLPQAPQSLAHSSPPLLSPHFSKPSQKPSWQRSMQKPAVQFPLRQTLSLVQGTPAGCFAPMQKPKLQMPLAHARSVVHGFPLPSPPSVQRPKLQIPLWQSKSPKQGVFSPQSPQSGVQAVRTFEKPQVSMPVQKPSPQTPAHRPGRGILPGS